MTARRASVYIGSLCLGIVVFLLFYLSPLVFLAQTRREFRNLPEIWIVPKPLISGPIASPTPKGSVLSYFGYEFESSTPEVKEEPPAENVVVLNFSDCARVVILKPQPRGPSPVSCYKDHPMLHASLKIYMEKKLFVLTTNSGAQS